MEENYVYHLSYTKEFKHCGKTNHTKISLSKEKLFEWVETFCRTYNIKLVKSEKEEDEFLFLDGDWRYFGYSEFLNLEFLCVKTKLF